MNVVSITPEYLSPQELYCSLKAMAILEIIMVPQQKAYLRVIKKHTSKKAYFIDNGAGDTVDILFDDRGILIKGFDHEIKLNQFGADKWNEDYFKNIYANIPQCFFNIYDNKEELYYMTFCMWYDNKVKCWKQNVLENFKQYDNGQDFLLSYIHTNARQWIEWAKYYFNMDINCEVVEKVYRGEQIIAYDVIALNPECDVKQVLQEILDLEC